MDSPLIAGGTTTRAEALIMILTHAAKHQITGSQLDDLLKLINCLFGQDVVPRSKYSFDKMFSNDEHTVEFHCYCKHCKSYCGTQVDMIKQKITHCAGCKENVDASTLNDGCFFINISIASQIKSILETPDLQSKLQYKTDRPPQADNIISDIYDGEMYKKLSVPGQILSDVNNLSYTFNSDGSPLYKSSKFSIWPIHVHLNELPPKLRFHHVMLAGLWFGPTEPVMHMFLKPFVEQAKSLVSEGVSWKRDGEACISKVVGICCSVDSKARPTMRNTTQFNGYYGCGFCLYPGTLVDKQVKYPITPVNYPDRDAESMERDMEEALIVRKSVRGVKGPSPLINMSFFDIVWGFTPDYMHCVLLGVTRQLATRLLQDSEEPYYVGSPNTLRVLDQRIKAIKTPHLITRLPRPISEYKFWKASEWRSWLLFYSLPCLEGLLDAKYTKHLGLLSSAIYLLLQDQITFEEINSADELLMEFVVRFQMLYGDTAMTFNVHLLTHLAKAVKYWGPLWAHSAFPFENANGNLLRLVHGTKDVTKQIAKKFLLHRSIPYLMSLYNVSDRVLQFCRQMIEYSKVQHFQRSEQAVVLDSGKVKGLSQADQAAFHAVGKVPPNDVLIHKRMIHNGLVFTSHGYSRAKRRDNSCVTLTDGSKGQIQQIMSYNSDGKCEIGLLFIPYQIIAEAFPFQERNKFVPHIKCAIRDDAAEIKLVTIDRLKQKCILVKAADKMYLCDFPNTYERD